MINEYNLEKLIENKNKIQKIFMYRVCGTGMGAAACLLKEKGYLVEGADTVFLPPMSDYLKSTGIHCSNLSEISKEYLEKFDLIVVGNVVPRNSKDADFIESLGIPFSSFPATIGALVLRELNIVGVAGTHGKTTTTYLLMQMFSHFNMSPGYFIGGVLDGYNSAKLGDGKYFFIESDEYDCAYFEKRSKFHNYFINHLIITSLEFDHGDIFESIQDIKNEFKHLLSTSVDGQLIYSQDYNYCNKLVSESQEILKSTLDHKYGMTSQLGPINVYENKNGSSFSLILSSKEERFETNLVGEHNILNLTSAIIFSYHEKIDLDLIKSSIKNLKLVKRRQEEKGYLKNSLVIDDFAHHPTAVSATIQSLRAKYPKQKLMIIFEPASATSRSSIFEERFLESLKGADSVLIARPKNSTTIKSSTDLDCDLIAEQLNNLNVYSVVCDNIDSLLQCISSHREENSIIAILSNSNCLGIWQSSFSERLQNLPS